MPITADQFREQALGLPETVEGSHMNHADFRVGGKVFASLGPDEDWGMVVLTPEGQTMRTVEEPDAFEPFPGAWGRRGCTRIWLKRARKPAVKKALAEAWRNIAPKRLAAEHDQR